MMVMMDGVVGDGGAKAYLIAVADADYGAGLLIQLHDKQYQQHKVRLIDAIQGRNRCLYRGERDSSCNGDGSRCRSHLPMQGPTLQDASFKFP
jgi:hypothetical protein